MTTKTPTTPATEQAAPAEGLEAPVSADVIDGEGDDLGINFFENFTAEGEEAAAPSSEDGEAAGGGDGSGDAPAGGDASAAPATPSEQVPAPAAAPAEAGQTPASAAPAQPAADPAAAAAAQQPAQQQTPAQPTQDQQQAPTQPADSGQPGDMLSSVRAEVDKNRATYTQLLAEKVYPISEDDARALFETPEKVLPNLAAKVHLEVVQNVLGTLAQILPSQIAAVQQAQEQNKSLLDDFWNSHPTLDRNADKATVLQLAQLYRAQNPNASFDDFKQVVGSQAMVLLKKLPVAGQPAQVQQPSAPARVAVVPPAARGGPPLAPTGQPSGQDFWAGFAEHLDE